MEKKYLKPTLRVQEMQMENCLNATTDDPTKVPVDNVPVSPEQAESKRVEWVEYLDE